MRIGDGTDSTDIIDRLMETPATCFNLIPTLNHQGAVNMRTQTYQPLDTQPVPINIINIGHVISNTGTITEMVYVINIFKEIIQ